MNCVTACPPGVKPRSTGVRVRVQQQQQGQIREGGEMVYICLHFCRRFAVLVRGMRECGYNRDFPVVLYEGKILDGRNRFLASGVAGVEPTFVELPDGADPAEYVKQANDHRRHETMEVRQKRR